jgi:hypothetical protein
MHQQDLKLKEKKLDVKSPSISKNQINSQNPQINGVIEQHDPKKRNQIK